MWFYIKILEVFLLKTLFSKSEYDIRSKHFSPLKLVVVGFLIVCTIGFFVLFHQVSKAYHVIETQCPGIVDIIQKSKQK